MNINMDKIKLGLLGLGEVTQLVHLPTLTGQLNDKFEIVAVCDLSAQLADYIGNKYQIPGRYTDYAKMLDHPGLQAVMIMNTGLHSGYAIAAINKGLHTFIEKPMSMSYTEADRVISTAQGKNLCVMVGYMRRYDEAFILGSQEISQLESINIARFRDVIGGNPLFTTQTDKVIRFTDVDKSLLDSLNKEYEDVLTAQLGSTEYHGLYGLLAGLSAHSLSAMRELFGMPKSVLSATVWSGINLHVVFEYDGFCTTYEMILDNQRRFDARIEVLGSEKTITIQYDSAYLKHLPSLLKISENVGEGYSERTVRPTYLNAFNNEFCEFYKGITAGSQPKTSPTDARDDLTLFKMILEELD